MTGMVAVVVVAAGRGERAGGGVPKQYRDIAGEPMIRTTLSGLLNHPQIGRVQSVIFPGDQAIYRTAVAGLDKLPAPVAGGATRQASVRAGLEALVHRAPEIVLIHDAARPFFTAALIDRAIAAGQSAGAAVPGIPIADTVKEMDAAAEVPATPDRSRLRFVQPPKLSPSI